MAKSPRLAFRFLAIAGLLAVVGVLSATLPIADYVTRLLDWIAGLGPWGPVVLIGIYVLACVLALPVWPLTLGAGFLFGLLWGTVTVSIGETVGAACAFSVARRMGRAWISQWFSKRLALRKFDRALSQQGFKIVVLLRLSPAMPSNVLNYTLGLTAIPLSTYTLATWLGILPVTLMYVYFGTAIRSLRDLLSGETQHSDWRYVLLVVGLIATVAATLALAQIARQAVVAASREANALAEKPAESHG